MQLGRCCKCGKTICEGYWLRNCVIESVTLDDIGLEEVAWTLKATTNGINYYSISDHGANWDLGTKKLAYGVRYNTFMPTSNNQQWWNTWNRSFSSSGGTVSTEYTADSQIQIYYPNMGGFKSEYGGSLRPPNFGNNTNLVHTSPDLVANGCFTETCHRRNHATTRPITQIVVPYSKGLTSPGSSWSDFAVRPLYFRFLADNEPVSDVLSLIDPDNNRNFRPTSDITKTNWYGVGNGSLLYENIDTDSNDTDYNWCESGVRTISHGLSNADTVLPFDRTGYKLHLRLARCTNTGGIPGSGDPGNSLNVTVTIGNAATVRASFTFTVAADVTNYVLDLSDYECVTINSLTNLRVSCVTSDSGGSGGAQRGLAIFSVKFTVNTNTSEPQYPFAHIGSNAETVLNAFAVAESQQLYYLQKNKKFGLDVWYELLKQSTGTSQIATGAYSTMQGSESGSAGAIGVKLEYAPAFDMEKHSLKLTFVGGVYRPWNCQGDVLYLYKQSTFGAWVPGTEIKNEAKINYTNTEMPSFASQKSANEGLYIDVETDLVQLSWSSEVPILIFAYRQFVPEDTENRSINYWYDNTPDGPYPTAYHYLQNSPSGFWNVNYHKFVLSTPAKISNNDPFVAEAVPDGFPDYIIVEKVRRTEQIVVVVTKNASGFPYTTWTSPPETLGVTEFIIECWGAGGGGAGWTYNPPEGPNPQGLPGAGGGGAYSRSVLSLSPSTNYRLYIGNGGACGDVGLGGALGQDGNDGEETSFRYGTEVLVSAAGGERGYATSVGSTGASGVGGSAANCVGSVKFSGGSGVSSVKFGTIVYPGVGGNSAGWEANGNNAYLSGSGLPAVPQIVKHGGVSRVGLLYGQANIIGPGSGGIGYRGLTTGATNMPSGVSGMIRISYTFKTNV